MTFQFGVIVRMSHLCCQTEHKIVVLDIVPLQCDASKQPLKTMSYLKQNKKSDNHAEGL